MSLHKWPDYDEALTIDDEVELVVQINGRVRDRFTMPMDAPEQDVLDTAFARERVRELTEGKTLVKRIVVPNRIVNIVVK